MKLCVRTKKKHAHGDEKKCRFFSFKAFWKVECIFLDDDKIVFISNTFLIVVSFFDAEGSDHDYMDSVVRILGGQGVDAWFAFEVDALLDEEGICKVK